MPFLFGQLKVLRADKMVTNMFNGHCRNVYDAWLYRAKARVGPYGSI